MSTADEGGEILLQVRDLKKWFPIQGGFLQRTVAHVRAIDGVSFTIRKGRTLGLVGESGCGKTTVGRTVLRLTPPTSGSIKFEGEEIATASNRKLRSLRPKMQIVFQDPMSSLNPRMTVKEILMEPLVLNGWTRKAAYERVVELLQKVGMLPEHANRFPHEFSGGQRQRIGVARALALNPDLIVLDEPTSALDVSVQAQVLNLLKSIQQEFDLTYLFISHDLGVIRHLCDDVAVMYLGRIVEHGPVEEIFNNPQHPYTQALLAAVPIPDPTQKAERMILSGDVPSPVNPPAACRFHPRCPRAQAICSEVDPPLEEKRPLQLAACHFPGPQEDWPLTQKAPVQRKKL